MDVRVGPLKLDVIWNNGFRHIFNCCWRECQAASVFCQSMLLSYLGITLDKNLSMNNHVNAVCKSVHYHSRTLCHIRSSISEDMAKMVGCALAGSRVDYANSVLFGATQKKTAPNSKKHKTSSPVSLPDLLNPAVHVLSSSSSTGSQINTASTSEQQTSLSVLFIVPNRLTYVHLACLSFHSFPQTLQH